MSRKDLKGISSYVTYDMWDLLKEDADSRDTSVAKLIARLIKNHCDKLEKKTNK